MRTHTILVASTITALILTGLIGLLYFFGYSLQNGTLVRGGTIIIENTIDGSEVFIDNKRRRFVSITGETHTIKRVAPGSHNIILDHPDFWPWAESIVMQKSGLSHHVAFQIPRDITTRSKMLDPESTEYAQEAAHIRAAVLPTKLDPLTAPNGMFEIWMDEEGRLQAKWTGATEDIPSFFCTGGVCSELLVLLDPLVPIRSITFYPKRSDILIVAIENGVFALEVNPQGSRNFQPIYKGTNEPVFQVTDEGVVSVRDGAVIFTTTL